MFRMEILLVWMRKLNYPVPLIYRSNTQNALRIISGHRSFAEFLGLVSTHCIMGLPVLHFRLLALNIQIRLKYCTDCSITVKFSAPNSKSRLDATYPDFLGDYGLGPQSENDELGSRRMI